MRAIGRRCVAYSLRGGHADGLRGRRRLQPHPTGVRTNPVIHFSRQGVKMRRSEGIQVLVAAAAALAVTSALARPMDFYNGMRDSPITRFSKADVEVMTKTINK